MTSIQSVNLSSYSKQIKNFFRENEQDSLSRHIFRQAILVSPCVFSALPFINIYDRRVKIPIALSVVGVAACALGWLKKRQTTIESKGELNSDDKIRIETNRFLRNFIWRTICHNTVQVLGHELGHYFAALALLNASPVIEIVPGAGGETTMKGWLFISADFFTEKRSGLGKKFDGKTVEAMIAGAGPSFQAIHICTELFFAFLLKKSHPEASDVFRSLAMQNMARLCGYSCTGFGMVTHPHILFMLKVADIALPLLALTISPKTGNMLSDICMFANYALPEGKMGDFSVLHDYGLHPLLCSSVSVAIPLTFQLLLRRIASSS